jgi:hypothetical protein
MTYHDPRTPNPSDQPSFHWPPMPASPPLPQPPAPKKKHTARNVALAVTGAVVLAVCGISTVGALVGGNDTTTGAISSDTTRDPTPEATTEATTAEPATPAAKPKPTTPAAKPLTLEQQNAIQAAQDYLDYTAFSRKGLIQQLHSDAGEGYPLKVATFAVDSLHVNWNEQAYKAAKQYLEYSSFSRKGLIEQLSSDAGEGFTYKQAVYGVTKAGL